MSKQVSREEGLACLRRGLEDAEARGQIYGVMGTRDYQAAINDLVAKMREEAPNAGPPPTPIPLTPIAAQASTSHARPVMRAAAEMVKAREKFKKDLQDIIDDETATDAEREGARKDLEKYFPSSDAAPEDKDAKADADGDEKKRREDEELEELATPEMLRGILHDRDLTPAERREIEKRLEKMEQENEKAKGNMSGKNMSLDAAARRVIANATPEELAAAREASEVHAHFANFDRKMGLAVAAPAECRGIVRTANSVSLGFMTHEQAEAHLAQMRAEGRIP